MSLTGIPNEFWQNSGRNDDGLQSENSEENLLMGEGRDLVCERIRKKF